ncbi:MAG: hypothetical protein JWQ97_2342 [Phenylobacterium sp.]|nr:hypothetical protein [Phenylobacterium sp.]
MPRSGSAAPPPQAARGTQQRVAAFLRRLCERLVLSSHALAVRLDLVPPEFGQPTAVDEADPHAVLAEWLRCMRLWADYNAEEVFAIKVGVALLGAALLALWVAVGLMQ